jgi:hypothetical protein
LPMISISSNDDKIDSKVFLVSYPIIIQVDTV